MSDWSISRRINVLSAGLVAALLVVALLGAMATLRLADVFGGYRASTDETIDIIAIQEEALEARIAELRYRLDGSRGDTGGVRESLGTIMTVLDTLEKSPDTSPSLVASIGRYRGEFAAYQEMFDKAAILQQDAEEKRVRTADAGALARLSLTDLMVSARANDDTLATFAAGTAQQNFLLASLYLERFFLSSKNDDFAEYQSLLQTARADLGRLSALAQARGVDLAPLLAQVDAFGEAGSAAGSAILARNEMRTRLDRQGDTLLDRLERFLDGIIATQTAYAAKGQTVVRVTMILLVAVSLLAALASAVVALRVARGIRSAIGRSVNEMNHLAEGHLDGDITGADKDHELGQIARALVVFRDNALAARTLAAQTAEQERALRLREEEQKRLADAVEAESRRKAEEARAKTVAELRNSIGAVVEGAAAGDFSRRITDRFAEEDFNRMADGVNRLMVNVETGIKEVARVMSRVAAGDLTERVGGRFDGLFAELQANVNDSIETLARVVDDIAKECDAVIDEVDTMSAQAQELARRAEQQAASLEETSAAMEEIAASARSSAEGAASANDFVSRATGRVDEAGRVVASAVDAMGDIRAASTRIGEIVSVIDGIAFQTNLLALNASVEAARAGSAGKGFAVVAIEVRALAQRSSAASQDIKALIDESAAQVSRGVGLVEDTGSTLKEIVEGVRGMAGVMGDLVTTGHEQAAGVQEVTTAISQLDAITQKNAALADRSRDATMGVKSRADAMRGLVGTFRTPGSKRRAPAASGSAGDVGWRAA